MISQSYRYRDDGKGGVRLTAGGKDGAASNKQVGQAMNLAIFIDYALRARFGHTRCSYVMAGYNLVFANMLSWVFSFKR